MLACRKELCKVLCFRMPSATEEASCMDGAQTETLSGIPQPSRGDWEVGTSLLEHSLPRSVGQGSVAESRIHYSTLREEGICWRELNGLKSYEEFWTHRSPSGGFGNECPKAKLKNWTTKEAVASFTVIKQLSTTTLEVPWLRGSHGQNHVTRLWSIHANGVLVLLHDTHKAGTETLTPWLKLS